MSERALTVKTIVIFNGGVRGHPSRRGSRRAFAGLALAALAAAGLVGCGAPPASSTLRVVAAENVWGDVAASIGGSAVSVTSLISDPNTDPHVFTSDVADTEAAALAKVVIVNGLGYDDFMARIVSSVGTSGRRIVTVSSVLHEAGGANPHLWYDVTALPVAARAIESAMVAAAPGDRARFDAGLTRFDASLGPLDATVATIRRRFAGAPVAYTERVPGYLLAAAGLRVLTPPGFARAIEDGTDPSVADDQAMEALVTGGHLRVLCSNSQTVTPVTARIRALAVAHRLPVVAVAETVPAGYPGLPAWQAAQARALLAALAS